MTSAVPPRPSYRWTIWGVLCGLAYVTAWGIIQLLAPKLEPARLKELA